MRIFHCIPSMGGGGAEHQLVCLAEGLIQEGQEVHVAHLHDGPNSERLRKSGSEVHRLAFSSHYDPRILPQIIRLARKVKPDLIHTWIPQMDVAGGIAAVWLKVPLVLSERSGALNYPEDWRMRLRVLAGRRAAFVIANSEGGRSYWISKGKSADAVQVIRNGIPFEEIEAASAGAPEELADDSEADWIVFAGRYSPEKNLDTLIAAMQIVMERNTRTSALFFGEGPLKERLMALRRDFGLENRLRIMGYTDRLWSILKRARLFVSVTLYEGNPNVVLEAAACRCPVLLSDIPAHREFLDTESAYFVPPDSPSAIAEGILKALREPGEARQKADIARSRVSGWSFGRMTQEYLRVYRDALAH